MASFQAKPERDWLRMRLKKKISFPSIPTRPRRGNSNKIAKKCKKIKKKSLWLHFKPKREGTG